MSDIQLKDVLKFEHSFCVLPFIHQHIDTKQRQRVCCHSTTEITPERLIGIQQDMLANLPVPECSTCTKCEQQKQFSFRQTETRDWFRNYPELCQDAIKNPVVISYDLRYSNNCNLRCQMCDAESSSEWARYIGKEVFQTWDPDSITINPDAKKIYFAGGEPFMIKSFSQVLNSIENTDCEIQVNTNATILTEHLLSALERFRDVTFILSIDGTGSTIEKIRTLCDWNIIQKNIDTLRHRLSPKFMVNTVLQKDNLDNIPELANWIDSKEISIWHAEILTRPEQFYFKNYASKLQWPESLWENACVQKNMQVYKNLKFIESSLAA